MLSVLFKESAYGHLPIQALIPVVWQHNDWLWLWTPAAERLFSPCRSYKIPPVSIAWSWILPWWFTALARNHQYQNTRRKAGWNVPFQMSLGCIYWIVFIGDPNLKDVSEPINHGWKISLGISDKNSLCSCEPQRASFSKQHQRDSVILLSSSANQQKKPESSGKGHCLISCLSLAD